MCSKKLENPQPHFLGSYKHISKCHTFCDIPFCPWSKKYFKTSGLFTFNLSQGWIR